MSRGTWTINRWSSGDVWVDDGTMYRPNSSLIDNKDSTRTTIILADGSKAFYTPETTYNESSLTFEWKFLEIDDSMIEKILDYIDDEERIKITTHNGENYIGYFTNYKKTELVGHNPSYVDFTAIFERE